MKSISLHPNLIFEREGWESLNGEWDFGFSKKAVKNYRFLSEQAALELCRQSVFEHKINVPFCVESELSGDRLY